MKSLSILFLRFHSIQGKRYPLLRLDFQFSFWDSHDRQTGKLLEAKTFNSLFEIPFQRLETIRRDRYMLSILFLRFENHSLSCSPLHLSRLSILFLRFPLWKLPWSRSIGHIFQFSFWDSVLFFRPPSPNSGILTQGNWYKPYPGIHLKTCTTT